MLEALVPIARDLQNPLKLTRSLGQPEGREHDLGPDGYCRLISFHVSVRQSSRAVHLGCAFRNTSRHSVYVQNRYGEPREFAMGLVGGGRSPNELVENRTGFTTTSACVWPSGDDSLLIFQGEVPCPENPPANVWPEPGYCKIGREESVFPIELALPLRQWENNSAPIAGGTRVWARRIQVCIEVLLDPLATEEIGGVFACDYGQPGYVETSVELAEPIEVILDPARPRRADQKRRALSSLARVGGYPADRREAFLQRKPA